MTNPILTPNRIVRHVRDLSPMLLAEQQGIRGIVCDLDNTLAAWHSEEITAEVTAWLAEVRKMGIGVCIASNTRNLGRLERLATHMGIAHVPGNAGKPGVGGLRRALHLLEVAPREAMMVGDQLFTDIVAGNRLGLYTVLVNPLSSREFIGTRLLSRRLERLVLRGDLTRPI